jgi:hypothetical protein
MFFLSTSFTLSLISQLALCPNTPQKKILSFVYFAVISNIIYIGKFLYEESRLIKTRDPLKKGKYFQKIGTDVSLILNFFKELKPPVIKENQITAPQLKPVLS